MLITGTKLSGVRLITPAHLFADFRGENIELFNRKAYDDNGITIDFVQDNITVSTKHVLRGLHGDRETWKLISCLYGKIYLVIINWDPESSEYRKWESFTLSDCDRLQVLIPPKFGNGHLVLSDQAIFHYKQSTYYNRTSQFTILWNDPKLNIRWPVKNPILSRRDQGLAAEKDSFK
jgi:dTDP-4-dehydrorhamnose 3,5-epimerase